MRIGVGEEYEGQKRAETSVKNCWTNRGNRCCSTFIPGACFCHERMCDMCSIIDAQPDGQHQVYAGYGINCESPKMHRPIHAYLKYNEGI